jgi:hypothetical protein
MYIRDLESEAGTPRLLHVGWLGHGQPYPQGPTPEGFLDKLTRMFEEPRWVPDVSMNVQVCAWCPPLPNGGRISGAQCLFVPSPTFLYVAPDLILHYVKVHDYLPPAAFIEAVRACPPQLSPEHMELLRPYLPYFLTHQSLAEYERTVFAQARKVWAKRYRS